MIADASLSEFGFRPLTNIDQIVERYVIGGSGSLLARPAGYGNTSAYDVFVPLGYYNLVRGRIAGPSISPNDGEGKSYLLSLSKGAIYFDLFFKERECLISEKFFATVTRTTVDDTGVFENKTERYSAELTEEIFGLSRDGWEQLLTLFTAFCCGYLPDRQNRGLRLTRSLRDSVCDFSSAWIPEQFPYISNTDGQRAPAQGGHYSLSAVIALTKFILSGGRLNPGKSALSDWAEDLGDEYLTTLKKVQSLRLPDHIVIEPVLTAYILRAS